MSVGEEVRAEQDKPQQSLGTSVANAKKARRAFDLVALTWWL